MDSSRLIIGLADLVVSLLFMALAVPLIRKQVPRNGIFGFRIRKAYESDENWYAINAYGGRKLLLWSVPIVVLGVTALAMPLGKAALAWFSYAPLIILAPIVETLAYARKL